jgi:hypothetical protein
MICWFLQGQPIDKTKNPTLWRRRFCRNGPVCLRSKTVTSNADHKRGHKPLVPIMSAEILFLTSLRLLYKIFRDTSNNFGLLHLTLGMKTEQITLILVIGALSTTVSQATNSTCYYPNGVASHGGACSTENEDSSCCGPSFVCLSNGLCAVGPDSRRTYAYDYYRSGCTDPYWKSASCPQVCTEREFFTNVSGYSRLMFAQRSIALGAVKAWKAVGTTYTAVQ